ncbi:MAG: MBL fold metallo-hydrolase, partial [Acidimicrobiales bacterium]
MTSSTPPRLAIGPEPVRDWVRAAVEAGGARIVPVEEAEGLVCKAILNTHTHIDHVGDNLALKDATGARLMLHEADLP